tara:strand:- start:515 stop:1324 length:810 start_codon:yes stop_codon:yes gene_type:complete
MKIILNKNRLIKLIKNEKNLGFVPTMGAIHGGHISLIKRSISQCNKTVVSIFINRSQFNKKSDYTRYPRDLNSDINKIKKLNIDYLFIPAQKQMYPNGVNKNIRVSKFSKKLCGKFRPGHFKAVVDIIDRFIKIIRPTNIYLGEKDMQQLKIIEHYIKKNNVKTKIVPCKTIREKNGLALSSRNFLLSIKEKEIAASIYKFLFKEKNKLIKNKKYLKKIKRTIFKYGVNKIDYIEILDINKIIKPYRKFKKYKIFIAYYIGKVRLIDNF